MPSPNKEACTYVAPWFDQELKLELYSTRGAAEVSSIPGGRKFIQLVETDIPVQA